MGVPPNEWFIMETPIKVDDLEVPLVPLFQETPIWLCSFLPFSSFSFLQGDKLSDAELDRMMKARRRSRDMIAPAQGDQQSIIGEYNKLIT